MKNIPNSDDQNFLELLRRWISGDFRRGDLPKVKDLTRSDDFRRESWEGYEMNAVENHAESLSDLRQKLAQRTGGFAAPLRVVWHINRITAAAAVMLALLAALWFVKRNDHADESATVAHTIENQTESAPLATTSPSEVNKHGLPPVATSPPDMPAASPVVVAPEVDAVGSENASDVVFAPDAQVAAAVEDKNNEPAPPTTFGATHELARSSDPPTATESAGAQTPALEQPTTVAPTTSVPSPAEKRSFDKASKKLSYTKKEKSEAPEPYDGWEHFHQFVQQHARVPAHLNLDHLTGTVILEFAPQPDGSTGPITVVQSSGQELDAEAIRLVQLFRWKQGKQNVIRVPVSFKK